MRDVGAARSAFVSVAVDRVSIDADVAEIFASAPPVPQRPVPQPPSPHSAATSGTGADPEIVAAAPPPPVAPVAQQALDQQVDNVASNTRAIHSTVGPAGAREPAAAASNLLQQQLADMTARHAAAVQLASQLQTQLALTKQEVLRSAEREVRSIQACRQSEQLLVSELRLICEGSRDGSLDPVAASLKLMLHTSTRALRTAEADAATAQQESRLQKEEIEDLRSQVEQLQGQLSVAHLGLRLSQGGDTGRSAEGQLHDRLSFAVQGMKDAQHQASREREKGSAAEVKAAASDAIAVQLGRQLSDAQRQLAVSREETASLKRELESAVAHMLAAEATASEARQERDSAIADCEAKLADAALKQANDTSAARAAREDALKARADADAARATMLRTRADADQARAEASRLRVEASTAMAHIASLVLPAE